MNAKRPPTIPDNLKNNIGFLLNKAARVMREEIAEALKPLALSFQDYVILRMVESQQIETQQELALRNGIDRTSMVDIIDKLEEQICSADKKMIKIGANTGFQLRLKGAKQ